MAIHYEHNINSAGLGEFYPKIDSALDAIFAQRKALLCEVGPVALQGMRAADEREASAELDRLDVSPRRLAVEL